MLRSLLARLLCFVLASVVSLCVTEHVCAEDKPNVIFILIDDMGWTDLSCMGSKFYETPHIDRMAAQGMKFTQAYSACTVCSPTRAAFLTGKTPARLHITDWIEGHKRPFAKLKIPDWTMYLPPEEQNIARKLKSAGYATASIGKWHLGDERYYPEKHGFDINIGGSHKGQPPSYFSPYNIPTLPDGPKGEFLSDRMTDETIKFISTNKEKPFFVYLPHFAVHTPIMGKADVIEKYKARQLADSPHKNAPYAALVESVDDSVGRILKTLDDLKLSEKTLVIFASDNGGLMGPTSNLPLRVGKGSAYEGGVRVPLIVKWPGVIKPGSECATPVITYDFYPTLLDACGVKDDPQHIVDGVNLMPLLKQSGTINRDTLYWHYPHYHPGGATPYSAIREGDFKLIEFFEDNRAELYNLKDDVGEKNDLAATMPDKAKDLRAKLEIWRQQSGAQLPAPNPNYDPEKDKPAAKKKKE
jgi:arylsulfatase A